MGHYQLTVLVTVCSLSLKVLLRETYVCFGTMSLFLLLKSETFHVWIDVMPAKPHYGLLNTSLKS